MKIRHLGNPDAADLFDTIDAYGRTNKGKPLNLRVMRRVDSSRAEHAEVADKVELPVLKMRPDWKRRRARGENEKPKWTVQRQTKGKQRRSQWMQKMRGPKNVEQNLLS